MNFQMKPFHAFKCSSSGGGKIKLFMTIVMKEHPMQKQILSPALS